MADDGGEAYAGNNEEKKEYHRRWELVWIIDGGVKTEDKNDTSLEKEVPKSKEKQHQVLGSRYTSLLGLNG